MLRMHYQFPFVLRSLPVSLAVAAVLFCATSAQAQWTDPTQQPPGGNTDTPINVSSDTQFKDGSFGATELCLGSECRTSWPGADPDDLIFPNDRYIRSEDGWGRMYQSTNSHTYLYSPGHTYISAGSGNSRLLLTTSGNLYVYKENTTGYSDNRFGMGDGGNFFRVLNYGSNHARGGRTFLANYVNGSAEVGGYIDFRADVSSPYVRIRPPSNGRMYLDGAVCIGGECRTSWPESGVSSCTLHTQEVGGTGAQPSCPHYGGWVPTSPAYRVDHNDHRMYCGRVVCY